MSDELMQMIKGYGVLRYRMGCSTPATSQSLAKETELLLANINDHIATLEQESAANLQRALVAEKEVKQLHISLAGAVQHGIEGWNRYESANKMCVNQQKDIQRLNSAASDLANSHIRRVAERNLLSFLKHSNLDESNLRSAFSCVGVLADTSTQEVANKGHGHVQPRPDGVMARCGGPNLCNVCRNEERELKDKEDK